MLRLPSWALGALALAGLTSLAAAAPAQVPTRPDTTRRPDSAAAARGDTVRRDSTRHDTTLTAAPDQARGIDAEVRAALYELLADRTLPALSRLDWIASSPVALTGVSDAPALMSRQDLLFLLSQAQYRLGMSDAFRATAQQLTGVSAPPAAPATPTTPSQTVAGSTRTRAGRDSSADSSAAAVAPATTASAGTVTAAPGRYAGLLQLQLTMDAYRRGDFAQAASLAGAVGSGSDRGLAGLIAGLANYGAGNWAGASSSFDAAVQAGGSFAPYAEYMRALALMHGDTTQAGAALDALQALGGRALAEFAEQVLLTAAQLAYHLNR